MVACECILMIMKKKTKTLDKPLEDEGEGKRNMNKD
jgi:hypothetical protein